MFYNVACELYGIDDAYNILIDNVTIYIVCDIIFNDYKPTNKATDEIKNGILTLKSMINSIKTLINEEISDDVMKMEIIITH